MTWTWEVDGLGTAEQTLRVIDPNGAEQYSDTREGWSWSGDYPDEVYQTVADHDTSAALRGDIVRAR